MTIEFTASNGYRIIRQHDDRLAIYDRHGIVTQGVRASLAAALREHFQHERDAELGRWRDPENPNLIVYPDGPDLVRVVRETTGVGWDVTRPLHLDDLDAPTWHGAAARYFAAHPEPKPWHDAREGDVWLVTLGHDVGSQPAGDYACTVGQNEMFYAGPIAIAHRRSSAITEATRIWPDEETTDE